MPSCTHNWHFLSLRQYFQHECMMHTVDMDESHADALPRMSAKISTINVYSISLEFDNMLYRLWSMSTWRMWHTCLLHADDMYEKQFTDYLNSGRTESVRWQENLWPSSVQWVKLPWILSTTIFKRSNNCASCHHHCTPESENQHLYQLIILRCSQNENQIG